ncbi:hypothetical protein RND81_09G256100 [Saponaria officinalis]|uniref:B30.2/SPRY domain-containing protein n=1 Tax=Saponaria officinalis TaxID=3572 RepID=A0AAW1IQW8_SAPOF
METLQDAYRDDEDDTGTLSPDSNPNPNPNFDPDPNPPPTTPAGPPLEAPLADPDPKPDPMHVDSAALMTNTEDLSSESVSEGEQNMVNNNIVDDLLEKLGEEDIEGTASKKQKSLSLDQIDASISDVVTPSSTGINGSKKSSKKKSKSNSVWTKPTSRKGKKKAKNNNGSGGNNNNGNTHAPPKTEDAVLVTPMPRFPDKNDDSPESKICLSKVYKAEKVELSEDRLSAGSCKGYRMVRATRGVSEGAWFFEIKVVHLGESGHTRLGWSTERGDLQAPVGYDGNSFGFRDIDGSKVHKALREKYGDEGYKEGDVIGFYISLPEGDSFAPKGPHLVMYKGQKYVCGSGSKEDLPKPVPGSEISFFKNGICQGVAFKDLLGGRYYPAASMYTLPNQPNCVIKFNFGPEFECFPADFEGRPVPRPMIEVPYYGYDNRLENGVLEENKQ